MIKKIIITVLVTAGMVLAYYGIFVLIQKGDGEFCKNYYCIDYLEWGSFLSIWIAIVGLYFIVTSIDDWKKQDQFLKARDNIVLFIQLRENFNSLIKKLNNINKIEFTSFHDHRRYVDDLIKQYELKSINRKIGNNLYSYQNLYHSDLEALNSKFGNILSKMDSNIKEIKENDDNKYEKDYHKVIKVIRNDVDNFNSKLNSLNTTIKKFSK